jgi:hypothetical protein
MLFYRTKRLIFRASFYFIFFLVCIFLIFIGANIPGRFGSKLPILLERTIGPDVRKYTGDYYAYYFKPAPLAGEYQTRKRTTFYSVMEWITLDPRISTRSNLIDAFNSAVEESFNGKIKRIQDLARLLEVQSLLKDKEAREIEPVSSATFNLNKILLGINFIHSFELITAGYFQEDYSKQKTGKKGKVLKKKKKKKKKKGKKKKSKKGKFKISGKNPNKAVFSSGEIFPLGGTFINKLKKQTNSILKNRNGYNYASVPVKNFSEKKIIGYIVLSFNNFSLVDLEAFYIDSIPVNYTIFSFQKGQPKGIITFKGPEEWMKGGKYHGPMQAGVAKAQIGRDTENFLVFEYFNPFGFKLIHSYPVRSLGYFLYRILLGAFLAGLIYLIISVISHFKQKYMNQPFKPKFRKSGETSLDDLKLSIRNTYQSIDVANRTLDFISKRLTEPIPVIMKGGPKMISELPPQDISLPELKSSDFLERVGKLYQNLDEKVVKQKEILEKLDKGMEHLENKYNSHVKTLGSDIKNLKDQYDQHAKSLNTDLKNLYDKYEQYVSNIEEKIAVKPDVSMEKGKTEKTEEPPDTSGLPSVFDLEGLAEIVKDIELEDWRESGGSVNEIGIGEKVDKSNKNYLSSNNLSPGTEGNESENGEITQKPVLQKLYDPLLFPEQDSSSRRRTAILKDLSVFENRHLSYSYGDSPSEYTVTKKTTLKGKPIARTYDDKTDIFSVDKDISQEKKEGRD